MAEYEVKMFNCLWEFRIRHFLEALVLILRIFGGIFVFLSRNPAFYKQKAIGLAVF